LKKFLIIRFSSIGDIVLTTPVIRCLKKQYPNVEIHFLTKPSYAFLLRNNPYISVVHELDKPLFEKAIQLKSMSFDYVIDLHNNMRTGIVKAILQIPAFSFDKLNTEKAILVKTGINALPPIHIVDRCMQTLEHFGVKNDGEGLDYFLPSAISLQVVLSENYTAFAIGAQHYTKRLPIHKIAEFIKSVEGSVVLLGGKEDEENGNAVLNVVGDKAINMCGKLSFDESALVVKNATKIISHDTGLMHVAAAFKKQIISVWGNTVPEFGMYPYYGKYEVENRMLEVKDLACRPCSKIGFNGCPKKHFACMEQQEFLDI